MAVLKLRTDGTVDEGAASSSSAAAAEAPTQATMATMMVTPETLTGTGGETSEGVSAVAVKETIGLPPVMLSMVKPQILCFKATEIQSHYMSFS